MSFQIKKNNVVCGALTTLNPQVTCSRCTPKRWNIERDPQLDGSSTCRVDNGCGENFPTFQQWVLRHERKKGVSSCMVGNGLIYFVG